MVLVTGVWLVLISADWKFTQLWILLALGAFVVAFLIGAVYLSRVAMQLERLVRVTDPHWPAVRESLRRWILGYRVVLITLLFVVWDMVFKPGL